MSNPYVGEIRMFGGNFAPVGWAFCDGQILSIAQNDTLFTLIGTTYGGDGQTTFALPDLRGRIPIHAGTGSGLSNRTLGESAGSEAVTLTVNQLPAHTHPAFASPIEAQEVSPAGSVVAQTPAPVDIYTTDVPNVGLHASSVANTGGSQPHDNVMPFLCVNFIISLFGIFPSQI